MRQDELIMHQQLTKCRILNDSDHPIRLFSNQVVILLNLILYESLRHILIHQVMDQGCIEQLLPKLEILYQPKI